jgi:hypothetical protein
LISNKLVTKSIRVKGVPIAHLYVGTCGVVVPIGAAIANSKALKVWLENISVVCVSNIVLVDLVSKVGDIDSGV